MKLGRYNYVDGKIAMRVLYETTFGIFNHLDKSNTDPFADVAFHPSEDINANSLLKATMMRYATSKVGKIFDLSYIELMNLPADVVDMMYSIADTMQSKESAIAQAEAARAARALESPHM